MNHSSHILLLAVALSAAGIAPAQTAATPEKERERATGPTYGPVLHPQAAPASQATPAALSGVESPHTVWPEQGCSGSPALSTRVPRCTKRSSGG